MHLCRRLAERSIDQDRHQRHEQPPVSEHTVRQFPLLLVELDIDRRVPDSELLQLLDRSRRYAVYWVDVSETVVHDDAEKLR